MVASGRSKSNSSPSGVAVACGTFSTVSGAVVAEALGLLVGNDCRSVAVAIATGANGEQAVRASKGTINNAVLIFLLMVNVNHPSRSIDTRKTIKRVIDLGDVAIVNKVGVENRSVIS
jgi:hypothetical protein